MTDKYVRRDATTGLNTETLPAIIGGIAQAGQIGALGADGRWDESMMPIGIVADSQVALGAEALTAGDYVYLNATGEIARASAASGGNPATGFVLESSLTGIANRIYFEGRNTAHTGLVIGSRYYLSDTVPGGIRVTPIASGAGKIHQQIGSAVLVTEMNTQITGDLVILAA